MIAYQARTSTTLKFEYDLTCSDYKVMNVKGKGNLNYSINFSLPN